VDQARQPVLPEAASPAALDYDSGMSDTKRHRILLFAAVLLAVLLGVALLTLVLGGDDERTRQPSVAPTAVTTRTPSQDLGDDDVPELLTTAPTGVTWELFQGVALPVSRTDGPTRVDGPVYSGFSRTPVGALLADAQISYRSLVDPDVANLQRVAEAQLADGPGKTAYLNLIGQLGGRNDPPAGGYAQIVGFRFITYTPDLAVISLATRGANGQTQVTTDTLRWVGNDWKLELPASGFEQPQVVQDTAGYVPWSGIS
jgi:hypothetical protein